MTVSANTAAAGRSPAAVRWLGDWPARVLAVVACAFLFAMMGFTFADVMGRYFFNSPLPAAYEIVSLMMPGIIFCALPLTNRQEGHVTIDLLDAFVPAGARRMQALAVNLFAGAAMVFVGWRLLELSFSQARFFGVTDELFLPLWPFSAAMAALCVVAALAFVANLIEIVVGRRHAAPAETGRGSA